MPDPTTSFTIMCQDDVPLIVRESQAPTVLERCEYFDRAFVHEMMRESSDRILCKPEWSQPTARRLISLLTKGKIILPDFDACQVFGPAADEILVGCSIPAPWSETDEWLDQETTRQVFSSMKGSKELFVIESVVTEEIWRELLSNGILLRLGQQTDKNLAVKLVEGSSTTNQQETGEIQEENQAEEAQEENQTGEEADGEDGSDSTPPSKGKFVVSAGTDFEATIREVCFILHEVRVLDCQDNAHVESKEMFQLSIKLASSFVGKQCPIPSVEAPYIGAGRTIVYEGSFVALWTLMASFFGNAVEKTVLCVSSPSKDTIAELHEAVHYCLDNPGTLGIDTRKNQYVAVKTYRDMWTMLNYLARKEPSIPRTTTFVEMDDSSNIF